MGSAALGILVAQESMVSVKQQDTRQSEVKKVFG